ncbi:MAG: hypothetical protein AB7F74_07365 [Parvibaculaceae bacterium]
MQHASNSQVSAETPHNGGHPAEPAQPSHHVQPVFVGTLLFIVFSVMAEYGLGEFAGLNIGGDFSVILGTALVFAIAAGLGVGVVHHWNHHWRSH